MIAPSFICLLFGGLTSAAALGNHFGRSVASKRETTNLTANNVIVFGADGRTEVWPKEKYEWLASIDSGAFELTAAAPPTLPTTHHTKASNSSLLHDRSCSYLNIVQENPDSTFLNWDTPMTSVVHATGVTNTLAITSGFMIADAVAVTNTATLTLVKDFLTAAYAVQYTTTWTTSTTTAYTYVLEPGNYGAIVTNARTLRRSGTVYSGCIGDASSYSSYTADSYFSQSQGGMAWIQGVISLCNGTEYPLPYCVGNGYLY
jgi:hypothetical protein